MLTGQYPSSHGAVSKRYSLSEEKVTVTELLSSMGYETVGFYSALLLGPFYHLPQGFELYERHGREFGQKPRSIDRTKAVSGADVMARARDWLRNRTSTRPFFLFVHVYDPHFDYMSHAPYDVYFDPDNYQHLTPGPKPKKPSKYDPLSVPERNRRLSLYDGEIRFEDRCVHQLLNSLEEHDLLDETLIMIVSDHGEEFLDHGGQYHGQTLYEEVIHVPLIVRYPGVFDGGRIVSELVSLTDLFPTIAELLDVDVSEHVQGVPLQGVLSGQVERAGVIAENRRRYIAFRSPEWKVIFDRKTGEGRLFSLLEDPGERSDVAEQNRDIYELYLERIHEAAVGRFALDTGDEEVTLTPEREQELRALGYVD
jgi:arylsulfatase A-like enzyme